MKRTLLFLVSLLAALALLCACSGAPAAPGSDQPSAAPESSAPGAPSSEAAPKLPVPGIDAENYPVIDGSTANHPLLARIYQEVTGLPRQEAETLVRFDLGSTGSIWERMLFDGYGAPDLLIVYEPPEEIKEQYAEQLKDLEIDPLGRDGLVFMVNAQNPVENLTVEQLRDIYTGKLTDWSQVGGEAGEIRPFQRNADSGSQTLFMKLLMRGTQPMEPPKELFEGTMGGLIDAVAEFDGTGSAIGYSVYYYANLMYANPSLKLISVDGVAPENETIGNGSYPLTNDFYVVIRADTPADSPVRALRDWLLSDEGRRILEEENYVWARADLPAQSAGAGNPFAGN